jgi:hypothetical protein
VILAVVGVGAAGGGIGTMFAAKGKASAIEDAADASGSDTNFPQGSYDDDVQGDVKSPRPSTRHPDPASPSAAPCWSAAS